jgi:hypothetical protein
VYDVCDSFKWDYGKKTIIKQEEHLGLVKHVFYCAALVKKYGSVILLEDDHYVSPAFYRFASQSLAFYSVDEKVSGISLFSIIKNGLSSIDLPFIPLLEDSDIFFAQLCVVHGFVLTEKMWKRFSNWFNQPENKKISDSDNIHKSFKKMDNETEWFHFFTNYLIKTDQYIVYPREAFCIHFQEVGTHFDRQGTWFQNPLQNFKQNFQFNTLTNSRAVYDSFLEIKPEILKLLNPRLEPFNFEIDFYFCKSAENIKGEFVLTSRQVKEDPILAFGKIMKPIEMNIINNIEGNELKLSKKSNVKFDSFSENKIQRSHYYFFYPGLSPKKRIVFFIVGLLEKLRLI